MISPRASVHRVMWTEQRQECFHLITFPPYSGFLEEELLMKHAREPALGR